MTAFNKNDIPDSVDTLEKAYAWVGTAFHTLNYDLVATEFDGKKHRLAQQQLLFVESTNETRIMLRGSLAVDGEYTYSGQKLWNHVEEVNSAPIPSEFLSE